MAPRKGNEPGSWELGEKKEGETRVRRSYCVKELVTREPPLPPFFHPLCLARSVGSGGRGSEEGELPGESSVGRGELRMGWGSWSGCC